MTKPSLITLTLIFSSAALALLPACSSSTPTQYHTLTPVSEIADRVGAGTAGNLQIDSVVVPASVDRSQMVVRESDSEVAILESERWSATLADELRSALTDQLSRLAANDQAPESAPAVHLRVAVRRFDSVPGAYGMIDAQWTLSTRHPSGRSVLTCNGVFRSPAEQGLSALVMAHQHNVQQFAAAISQSMQNLLDEQDNCS